MQKTYAFNERINGYSESQIHYRKMRNRYIAGAVLGAIVCLCYTVFA